jgi:hypothetical protein
MITGCKDALRDIKVSNYFHSRIGRQTEEMKPYQDNSWGLKIKNEIFLTTN